MIRLALVTRNILATNQEIRETPTLRGRIATGSKITIFFVAQSTKLLFVITE